MSGLVCTLYIYKKKMYSQMHLEFSMRNECQEVLDHVSYTVVFDELLNTALLYNLYGLINNHIMETHKI